MTTNTTIDLSPFRTAETLLWKQWTVFAPHRGDDGTLIADSTHRLPLDTRTVNTFRPRELGANFLMEQVGIASVDAVTIGDVRDAVRAWCREYIGRDDIRFED